MVDQIGSLYASRGYRASKKVEFDTAVRRVINSRIVQAAYGDLSPGLSVLHKRQAYTPERDFQGLQQRSPVNGKVCQIKQFIGRLMLGRKEIKPLPSMLAPP